MAETPCCDRQTMGNVLTTLLGNYCASLSVFSRQAAAEAEKLGVPFRGELETSPDHAKMLRFDYDKQLRVKWSAVDAQLDAIGPVTALYSVPREWVLGIEGEKGDVLIRLIDMKQHRLDGVLTYLHEKRQASKVP